MVEKEKKETIFFADKMIIKERKGGKYLEKERLSRVDGRISKVLADLQGKVAENSSMWIWELNTTWYSITLDSASIGNSIENN